VGRRGGSRGKQGSARPSVHDEREHGGSPAPILQPARRRRAARGGGEGVEKAGPGCLIECRAIELSDIAGIWLRREGGGGVGRRAGSRGRPSFTRAVAALLHRRPALAVVSSVLGEPSRPTCPPDLHAPWLPRSPSAPSAGAWHKLGRLCPLVLVLALVDCASRRRRSCPTRCAQLQAIECGPDGRGAEPKKEVERRATLSHGEQGDEVVLNRSAAALEVLSALLLVLSSSRRSSPVAVEPGPLPPSPPPWRRPCPPPPPSSRPRLSALALSLRSPSPARLDAPLMPAAPPLSAQCARPRWS